MTIMFARVFPAYHPRKGEPSYFVEKILNGLNDLYIETKDESGPTWSDEFCESINNDIKESKYHTIRAGHRFKVGDKFSPRVWSGKPYRSKQIIIAPDIEVKKVWDFEIVDLGGVICFRINGIPSGQLHPFNPHLKEIAKNDGLITIELIQWFKLQKGSFQIICWNENIAYDL